MCQAFSGLGITVTLALPGIKIKKQDIHDYIYDKYGINIKFTIYFFKYKYINRILNKYLWHRAINDLLLKYTTDVAFTRTVQMIGPLIDNNINVIYESHNNKLHNNSFLIDTLLKNILLKYSNNKHLTRISCISERLARYWADRGIPEEKLLTLHDGFSAEMFKNRLDTSRSRQIVNIPNNKKIVVYAGSLYQDREIENILVLAKELTEANFIIIGGPEKRKIFYLELMRKMGLKNVEFLGHMPHHKIPLYLYSANLLLAMWSPKVPTIGYCSPLKVFEYMASGTPIIAHDFPTVKEVLNHGHNAYLVEYGNKRDLLSLSRKVLNSSSNKIGDNARDDAFAKYTWRSRAKKYLNVLRLHE